MRLLGPSAPVSPASVMHPHSPPGSVCVLRRRSVAEKSSSQRADESAAGLPSHSVWRHGRYTTPRTTWESSSVESAVSSASPRLLPLQHTSSPGSSTTCSAHESPMTNPYSTSAKRGGVEACRDAAPQAGCAPGISNHPGRRRLIVPSESAWLQRTGCRGRLIKRLSPT
jgi:hypothetical protein